MMDNSSNEDKSLNSTLGFPQGFLWGAATSAHQIEGNNHYNDWWEWEKKGNTHEPSEEACNSYVLYEKDFDLAQELNHNAHRFSIEWSRIQPTKDSWNHDEIFHYQKILRSLIQRGIEPVVTLHHFTNPSWVSQEGGWENPEMVNWYAEYVKLVVRNLGCDVKYWITLNEQNVMVFKGYIEKSWPPGKSSLKSAIKATRNLARAHIEAYKIIHDTYKQLGWKKPAVGLSHHFMVCEPKDRASLRDKMVSKIRAFMNNDLFLRLVYQKGVSFLSLLWGLGRGNRALDFVGVNYYFREIVKADTKTKGLMSFIGEVCREDQRYLNSETNDLNWEVYPEGIARTIKHIEKKYSLPAFITENGICTGDEKQRIRFIHNQLKEIQSCIQEGYRVWGYLHWSLLDNFEWSIGYSPRFGLIHVDFDSKKRTIKESAYYFAEICRQNKLVEA